MGKQATAIEKAPAKLIQPDPKSAEKRLFSLVKRSNEIVIRTQEDYDAAGLGVKLADEYLASPEIQAFKKHAADAGAVHKQAVAIRDRFVKGALNVKRILSEKRVAFDQKREREAERKRAEEAERLRLRGIEDAKKEAKTLRRVDPEAAKELVEAAKAAPAPSLPSRTVSAGEGFVRTTTYGFEIETPEKVPAKYWVIDESLIRKDVNNFGEEADIPGVRIWPITKEHTRPSAA